MKVNIWDRDKGSTILDTDSIYESYRPAGSSVNYNKYYKKNKKENKWVIQILVSGVLLLGLFGLFKGNIPFTGTLKNGVRYLMTAETDVQPVLLRVVQLASQAGNLEWPLVDDTIQPTKAVITQVPAGAVLLLPVSGDLLSTYGWNVDPADKVQKFNEGIDIAVPVGTPVKAAADGKVTATGDSSGIGKYVLVTNSSGELVRYANLSEIAVETGQQVKAGEVIAKSGVEEDKNPHVHFELIVDGRPVDPLTRLGLDFNRIKNDDK